MTRRGYKIPQPQLDPLLQVFLMGVFLWMGWYTVEFIVFILAGLTEMIRSVL